MIRLLRGGLFLLAFMIDVKVKADVGPKGLIHQNAPVTLPENCVEKSDDQCGVKTSVGRKFRIKNDSVEVILSSDTSFLRLSEKRGRILGGTLVINSSGTYELEGSFGTLKLAGGRVIVETFVRFQKEHFIVKNISASLSIQGMGASIPYDIDKGYEVEVGPVGKTGHVFLGVPRAIIRAQVLRIMAQTFYGSKKEFLSEANSWMESVPQVVEFASESYAQEANRQIASAAQDLEAQKRRQKELLAEQKRIRDLFFRKTFE